MCSALIDHCQAMINESLGNQMSLYIWRQAHWKRHDGESIQTYADRFKTHILDIAPSEENRNDQIWLFQKELPAELKAIVLVPPAMNNVEFLIQEIVNIANSLEEQDPADDLTGYEQIV